MMANAFNLDSMFGKMLPDFPSNIFERFNAGPEEEVIEQMVWITCTNINISNHLFIGGIRWLQTIILLLIFKKII